ncbi:PKD domain-containing protein [Aquimarina pacifica]|uniref:PKD domain-containing protein n=1 Tax=Aquimarina pacifica TaxID=1296415 RepID=UPI00046FB59A|nr:PKD domain-containing protein [Aquimarina pacifica]
MITKLAKVTQGFRRFSKSQYLEESHLNQIVDHFDDQIRLSRIGLSGVGIVCGFEVSRTANEVIVNQGLGITTDGDLLHLYEDFGDQKTLNISQITYNYYREYDNSKADYSPFFYQGEEQIILFELLSDKEDSETFAINEFEDNQGTAIEDMVVLIYLEHYERNTNQCSSLSCDGEGVDVVANYRMLMTTKANAAYINSHDTTIRRTNYKALYYDLPEIFIPKVIPIIENFESYEDLMASLAAPFKQDQLIPKLKEGFVQLLEAIEAPAYSIIIETKIDEIFDFPEDVIPQDIQYRYDVLKDIVDTYTEIKQWLLKLSGTVCNPNVLDFPKHLMLGELLKEGPCFAYKHSFYASAVNTYKSATLCHNCNDEGFEDIPICFDIHQPEQRLKSLLFRAVKQLENYHPNYDIIKITPSLDLARLGEKAIPFYSQVDTHLLKVWDFDKTSKNREAFNIGYHDTLLAYKNPLNLSIDTNFYRIEGHQGRNYKNVISELKTIKSKKGISFNIVALGVSENIIEQEDYTQYYLNKRSGLEHKAGVSPRGTFVVVFLENYIGFEGEGETILEEPVIADFMVPYLCCDESVLALELPVNTLCFGHDTEPIPFNVTPPDGFVTAIIPVGLSAGIIRDENGQSFFDPNQVSPELIGTLIKFEVNNQDTEAEITIHRKPEPIITTNVNYDNPYKTVATVTYTVSGSHIDEIETYEWDFGDGTVGNDIPNGMSQVLRTYDNPPETAPKTITPSLRVTTAFCENTILLDPITLDDPIVIELELDRNEICVTPSDCDLPIHIAVIVDESGSIRNEEITQIQDGLTLFIDDQEGTNNLITLLNMSNNDDEAPLRIIEETQVTTSTKSLFTNWIENYRNGQISSGADYWSSSIGYLVNDLPGITNGLQTNPDIVILITDGIQLIDPERIKERVASLNERSHIFFYALTDPDVAAGGYGNDLPGYLRDTILDRVPIEIDDSFSTIETADYGTFNSFEQLGEFLRNLKQILDNSVGCIEVVNAIVLEPEDGSIDTAGMQVYAGLTIDERSIFINPKEFEAFGEVIEFTVDGFATEATLIVGRTIENVRLVVENITYNAEYTEANVQFKLSGDYLEEPVALLWNFGDEEPVFRGDTLVQEYLYTDLESFTNRTVNVAVISEKLICGSIKEAINIVFDEPAEEVSLKIPETLCLDTYNEAILPESVPFETTPDKAEVKPVTEVKGMTVGINELLFTAGTFTTFNIPIEFTVDGQVVTNTITVYEKPRAVIRSDSFIEEGVLVTEGPVIGSGPNSLWKIRFTFYSSEEDDNEYTYRWDFGDGSTHEGNESQIGHIYSTTDFDFNVTVKLVIIDKFCESYEASLNIRRSIE